MPQAAVRAALVVVPAVEFDHRTGLVAAVEGFHVETLICQGAVESFVHTVLPGAARLDVPGRYAGSCQNSHQMFGDEFRAVVASYKLWRGALLEKSQQRAGHKLRIHPILGFHGDALPRELINDC